MTGQGQFGYVQAPAVTLTTAAPVVINYSGGVLDGVTFSGGTMDNTPSGGIG